MPSVNGCPVNAQTRYARSGDAHIAYQVTGSGKRDLVCVPGFVSHLEADWENPARVRFFERLGTSFRLIRFDKRGTGMSDRVAIPSLEQRMDDVRAVMDAAGSQRAALFGVSEGGPMSLLFAATYPERTDALVIFGSYARRLHSPDHPFGMEASDWAAFLDRMEREWGGPVAVDVFAPGMAGNEMFLRAYANYLRQAASPGAMLDIMRMNREIDVRHVLPAIRLPTLILHKTGDRLVHLGQGRHLAQHIDGARFIELPGDGHLANAGDYDLIAGAIEEFLTGEKHDAEVDRVLATIMFTDIVGSTEINARLGDRQWRDALEGHHAAVRRELARFRGREVDTAGDGFFATFDGPARAIRCATAISAAVRTLGLEVRAGLHTGECEMLGDKVTGIAVNIGARIAARASAGEVLVSSTVKDLVAGSGLRFEERGVQSLKGVPGEWRLYAVAS